jgi:hypothetical protein
MHLGVTLQYQRGDDENERLLRPFIVTESDLQDKRHVEYTLDSYINELKFTNSFEYIDREKINKEIQYQRS